MKLKSEITPISINRCFSTLGCADRSLSEILALAKQYSIPAIEVRGIGGELRNEMIPDFAPANAENTKRSFEAAGVRPLVLGTSVSFHDINEYEKNMEEGKRALEIVERIGFSAIRVFGNRISGDEKECVSRVAKGIRELSLYAENTGVSVFLEVHGDFNTPDRLLPVTELCGDFDSFGLIWDICHTHNVYGKNWQKFYDTFAPFIRHVHIKDIKAGQLVLPGEGELEIVRMIHYMNSKGYKGYFSLEWEKHWHKELPEIEQAIEKLEALFE